MKDLRTYLACIVVIIVGAVIGAFAEQAMGAAVAVKILPTTREARELIRAAGGHPHVCKALSPSRIRCTSTWWGEGHEGEEIEPGVVVETRSWPVAEQVTVELHDGMLTTV